MEFIALEQAQGLTDFDIERIAALHRALAPSAHAYDIIHTHCVIVARLALSVARADGLTHPDGTPLDERLLALGGMVHDIGTYQLIKSDGAHQGDSGDGDAAGQNSDGAQASAASDQNAAPAQGSAVPEPLRFKHSKYIQHGLRGYKLLKACGFGEDLAQFARNHTGIGLTAQMVKDQKLPLPVADYVPVTVEQELVMYADKFHTKSDPAEFVGYDRCIRRAAKHGEANAQGMRDLIERFGMPPIEQAAQEYGMVLR